ncbi:MAG: NAD+ synthase [Elusimicrobia bacterium RIFCSPLOWO2_12_FULL_59_9]|nr:MAG: NAD+ synthase [Elusimicrobia bacterium RIFCSPLOWO2_12_FULL_59_9]
MKIVLAQINTTVGDIGGNMDKIRAWTRRASAQGADLCVFPEMSLTGYPPLDLLEQRDFVAANLRALKSLARWSGKTAILVGYVDFNPRTAGKPLHNAAALLHRGRLAAKRFKTLLPAYDVFDETRYFEPARSNSPVPFRGERLGISICEDAWNDATFWPDRRYPLDPLEIQKRQGASTLINIAASPFWRGKNHFRGRMFKSHAVKLGLRSYFCNLVGGNDELIFDGHSLAFDARGRLLAQGASFEEDFLFLDLDDPHPRPAPPRLGDTGEIYLALVAGLRDYAQKCGFETCLLGLSGGIDSAVACALACAALGPGKVIGAAMPSMHSSEESLRDARRLAENLGVRFLTLPITGIYRACMEVLDAPFKNLPEDVAEQNLQARIRGNLLMALSNKFNALLLSTGNKSELATGYCTLYGDMNGGLAVLGDVPKTTVYALAAHINREKEIIPRETILKAPSAELKPGQTDQDDLPPYADLDRVLEAYIEKRRSLKEIQRMKILPADEVRAIIERVNRNEYKRRQAPPVLKITPKAFGIGRRMPIARAL